MQLREWGQGCQVQPWTWLLRKQAVCSNNNLALLRSPFLLGALQCPWVTPAAPQILWLVTASAALAPSIWAACLASPPPEAIPDPWVLFPSSHLVLPQHLIVRELSPVQSSSLLGEEAMEGSGSAECPGEWEMN